ncbi:MAG: hypothetical protein KDC54_24425 [Lewinella sp.]|nr:hypothetical protein [Lewinella sp.]
MSGISLIFLVILATNLIDRNNFIIVKNSVETIYHDRLVAKDIILNLYQLTWEKELAYASADGSAGASQNSTIDTRITELLDLFATTRLTGQEAIVFEHLKKDFADLKARELAATESPLPNQALQDQLGLIRTNLNDLSDIQMKEGRRELLESQRAIEAVDLFTQLEIYALIILAIAIQIMIMYNPNGRKGRQEPTRHEQASEA